jgi:hypothetical protein
MNSANKAWIEEAVDDIIQEAIRESLEPDLEGIAKKLLIEAFNRGTVSELCKD